MKECEDNGCYMFPPGSSERTACEESCRLGDGLKFAVPRQCFRYIDAIHAEAELRLGRKIEREAILLAIFLEGLGVMLTTEKAETKAETKTEAQ